MTIGLGTGSTMGFALAALHRRIQTEGLAITGVPTSAETARVAVELGIPLADFDHVIRLDLALDGADEVDPAFSLIKGGSGALVREKITASAAERVIIIVDAGKLVPVLGKFPLPVAVVPFGLGIFIERMRARAVPVEARQSETDDGHRIVDCSFGEISNPADLQRELIMDPSVVETGLFVGLCDTVVVGDGDSTRVLERG
jgi:ribose 5-phosphate isomerase A